MQNFFKRIYSTTYFVKALHKRKNWLRLKLLDRCLTAIASARIRDRMRSTRQQLLALYGERCRDPLTIGSRLAAADENTVVARQNKALSIGKHLA